MNYYLITGTSRGIGEAIARKLLSPGNTLFCISRTLNEDLAETASAMQVPVYYTEGDLADIRTCEDFIASSFDRIKAGSIEKVALINNAGVLEPMAPVRLAGHAAMKTHLEVNLLAPAVLTSAFLQMSASLEVPRVILNISSGAAFIPYEGWSMYCSSKAGLDMFTRVAGMEQADEPFPAKIISLAPGIIETALQEKIRAADPGHFKQKQRFVTLFEEGRLTPPESLAEIIVKSIFNPGIPQGAVLKIDELKSFCIE